MKKIIKKLLFILALAGMTGMLYGCGSEPASSKDVENGVKKIVVGYASNGYPLAYQDEDGNYTGYELEVLKEADRRLEDYEFEYVEGAQDALYAGLGTQKYDLVVTNAFYTEERAKNYILPEHPLGASLVGLILKKDISGIATMEDAAKADLSLAPILAGDGLYYVVAQYNEENPGNQLELSATDDAASFMNAVSWIAEGRYDTAAWPRNYWEQVVKAEDGSLHDYFDELQFVECRSVYTYPVIAKGQEALAEALDPILNDLYEEGLLEELSEQFYGYDVFQYEEGKVTN
ncbi:MAG: transporter substrate-binding domain-containing protein [Blautia sp.]|nr:transporter substrate-binding domain-containing protein [Blautia sp.]